MWYTAYTNPNCSGGSGFDFWPSSKWSNRRVSTKIQRLYFVAAVAAVWRPSFLLAIASVWHLRTRRNGNNKKITHEADGLREREIRWGGLACETSRRYAGAWSCCWWLLKLKLKRSLKHGYSQDGKHMHIFTSVVSASAVLWFINSIALSYSWPSLSHR